MSTSNANSQFPDFKHTKNQFPQSEQNYPKNPVHYTPNYVPNFNPQNTRETHIVYDNSNSPYVATASNETSRIGGDRTVESWEYPHHIQIGNSSTFFCGGALVISPSTGKQLILTAGHCIVLDDGRNQLRPLNSYYVRAGNVVQKSQQGQFLRVKHVVMHPDVGAFKINEFYKNDIAIIFADGEFILNWNVHPIALPWQGQPLQAQYVTVTGWGYGRDGNSRKLAGLLKVVNLPIVDQKTCQSQYNGEVGGVPGDQLISDKHFCAGFMQGGIDTCHGDSGGPATALYRGTMYLAGLVNWGKGCARAGFPGVYAKMSSYVDWVAEESIAYQVLGKKEGK